MQEEMLQVACDQHHGIDTLWITVANVGAAYQQSWVTDNLSYDMQ